MFNIVQDQIELIQLIGQRQVYDFQVQNQNHNYIAQDIIVSNCAAHRYSCRVTSVWCAWLLNYYPAQWISSLINQDAQNFLPQIIKCYKKQVLPVDMFKSQLQTTTQLVGQIYKVRLGLNIIKGLGDKSLQKFMSQRNEVKLPQDFLFGFSKTITTKLINSGACDILQPNRKRLRMAANMVRQKTLKKKDFPLTWAELKKISPYSRQQLYQCQVEAYGMNVFVNLWQSYSGVIKRYIMNGKAVLDFSNFKSFGLNIAYVPVRISDIKMRNQKNNKKMAFVKFVTPSGQVEQVPIFSNTWEYMKKKIKADFSVYFALFSWDPQRKSFKFGDGQWQCNQNKANTFLLNLKYINENE